MIIQHKQRILGTVLSAVVASFLVVGLVSAVSTIGTNVTTDGNLTINGNTTLGNAVGDLVTVTGTIQGASPFVFEGATANDFETTFAITEPTTPDKTITFPDLTGTVVLSGHTFTGDVTATLGTANTTALTIAADSVALTTDTSGNYVTSVATSAVTGLTGGATASEGATLTLAIDYTATLGADPALAASACVFATTGLICEGATADGIETLLTFTDPTVTDKTITFPNITGTVITTGDTATVTSLMIGANVVAMADIVRGTDGQIIVANTSADSAYVTMSGDATLSAAGALTIAADAVGSAEIAANTVAMADLVRGTNGQIIVANTSADSAYVTMSGDATLSAAGALTIAADSVALTTDTSGSYVTSVATSAVTGLTGGAAASEGATLTLAIDYTATLVADPALAVSACVFATTGLICEGATADGIETLLTFADPTVTDKTITFPNITGTVITTGDTATVTSLMIAVDTIVADDIATDGVATAEILDNTITATDLNATLTFADADFINLAAILHDDTAVQGLRLPNVGGSPADPTGTGEGYIAWNETDNQLLVNTGAAWSVIGPGTSTNNTWTGTNTYETDVNFTFLGAENLAITNDATATVDVISLAITPSASAGTIQGIKIDNVDSANANGIDVGIEIDNSDITGSDITDGILFTSAGGAITNAINAVDTDIVNAISVGTNVIAITTGTIGSNDATVIDFVDFDVSADGLTVLAPDGTGVALTLTLPAADTQGILINAASAVNASLLGLIDLNIATATDGFEGINMDLQVDDDAGADTIMGIYLNIDDNATTANDTVYGLYIEAEVAGSADADLVPTALIYLDNSNTDATNVLPDAIFVNDDGGTITNALNASDAGIVNAINVGANVIAITTGTVGSNGAAVIDFLDFDVDADGLVVFASDGAGDQITMTSPAADWQALVIDAATADSTNATGLIQLTMDTVTASANAVSIDFQVNDAGASSTYIADELVLTIDADADQTPTVYGKYVSLTVNEDTAVTYGIAVEQQDAGGQLVTAGLLIDNLDTAQAMTSGILLRSAAGAMTTAINASDAEIGTALSIGANTLDATELDFNIAPTASGSSIAITASADAEDFLIDLIGAFNTTLTLRSAGNSTNAMELTTTAGGMDISVTGNLDTEDLDITALGATTEIRVSTESTTGDAIRLLASAGGIDIDATNSTFVITNTSNGAGDDFTIQQVGANDASLLLTSAGTGADAIGIFATGSGGGVVISAGEAAGAGIASTVNIISETVFDNSANVAFAAQAPTAYTASTAALTPTSSLVKLECNRAGAADTAVAVSETGAVDGQLLIVIVSATNNAGTCSFPDDATAGQQLAGVAGVLDDLDSATFIYDGTSGTTQWIRTATADN